MEDFHEIIYGWKSKLENIKIYNILKKNIKISAEENFELTYFKIPGCVTIDIHKALKKIYSPKVPESIKLKFFLEDNGLTAKIDLPHDVAWRYYKESKYLAKYKSGSITCEEFLKKLNIKSENEVTEEKCKKQMKDVVEYCINDSISCQRLAVKRDIIRYYKWLS